MSTQATYKSEYKHLKSTLVDKWVNQLLLNKGGEKQIELIEKVCDLNERGEEFSKYIEQEIADGTADPYAPTGTIVPSLDDKIAFRPGHMYLMPAKDIVKLYTNWKDIPYADAATPTLWGAITLSEIRVGRIKPVWLVVDSQGDEEKAQTALDASMKEKNSDLRPRKIDRAVRRILRWMMGPGQMRGGAELYGNCSLAKAWWCGWLAEQCSQCSGEIERRSHEQYVKLFQGMWLELADYISGKLTVVREHNVASGLALWVEEWLDKNDNAKFKRMDVREAIHALGKHSAWSCLGLFPPDEIKKILISRVGLLAAE